MAPGHGVREKRLALSVPLDGFTLPEHAELAREGERLGYSDAWSYEADGVDAFAPLAVVAMATGLRVGTAIVNVFTRGPATLASCAAGLAELAPGRFCLGIGAGSQVIVEGWNGGRFQRPATRVREMATILRRMLAGERVVFKGETVSVDGFRLARPPAHPPAPASSGSHRRPPRPPRGASLRAAPPRRGLPERPGLPRVPRVAGAGGRARSHVGRVGPRRPARRRAGHS